MLMATPIKKRRQLVDPTGDQLPLDVKTEGLRCCQLTQAVHDFVDGNSSVELHGAAYFLARIRVVFRRRTTGHYTHGANHANRVRGADCDYRAHRSCSAHGADRANVFMEVISPINIGCPKLYYE